MVYGALILANSQLQRFSNKNLQGFPSKAEATSAERNRHITNDRHSNDLARASVANIFNI